MDVRNKTAFLWLSRTLALKCSNFKKNVHIHYYLIYILKNVKRLRKSAFLRFFSVTENHCGCQPIINCASKTPLNKVLFMSNLRSCCCKKVSSIHVINSKGVHESRSSPTLFFHNMARLLFHPTIPEAVK